MPLGTKDPLKEQPKRVVRAVGRSCLYQAHFSAKAGHLEVDLSREGVCCVASSRTRPSGSPPGGVHLRGASQEGSS